MTSITINVNKKRSNVILGEEIRLLVGSGIYHRQDRRYFLSVFRLCLSISKSYADPEVFMTKALEYADLHGEETVWDLYCGIGTISLFLAQKAKFVRGVEIVPAAIENAKENAKLNGLENTEFFVGKAEEVAGQESIRKMVFMQMLSL